MHIPHTNNEKEKTQKIDQFSVFLKQESFPENMGLLICTMVRKGRRKFKVLATRELLLWHFLVLFHFQTQQYEITMFDLI